jgi:uncharacterized protein (DUF2252 family)
VAERTALGKAARERAPRSSQSAFEPTPDRDALALLAEQDANRLPELVPIRYGRMLTSPFAFFRGAAVVMAHDLAGTPRTGLDVQLCGDAHLSNFGGFGSPERALVFDVNDFDETHPGPFEWDLKRLAASFEIAGRDRGFDQAERREAVLASVRSYRVATAGFAAERNLDVWYARLDADTIESRLAEARDRAGARAVARQVEQAHTRDSLKAFSQLTEIVRGEPRIVSDPPRLVPLRNLGGEGAQISYELHALFRGYRRSLAPDRRTVLDGFRICDVARKIVGVGSVGTRCWVVLLLGRDGADPLFLQIKEANHSVLEPVLVESRFRNQGQRVVEGQRLLQGATDIFLGWMRAQQAGDEPARDYYVRQLWDWKTSVKLDSVTADALVEYAEMCGWTLAHAHARSGDRIALAGYLGKGDALDRALATFANAYADQNERDHEALSKAVRSGRVAAETGV